MQQRSLEPPQRLSGCFKGSKKPVVSQLAPRTVKRFLLSKNALRRSGVEDNCKTAFTSQMKARLHITCQEMSQDLCKRWKNKDHNKDTRHKQQRPGRRCCDAGKALFHNTRLLLGGIWVKKNPPKIIKGGKKNQTKVYVLTSEAVKKSTVKDDGNESNCAEEEKSLS